MWKFQSNTGCYPGTESPRWHVGKGHKEPMKIVSLSSLMFVLAAILVAQPVAAAELVMLEETGCPWCERWNREIGVIYHKTDEGRRAPLRRVDIDGALPNDLKFLVKGNFTPAFVLVDGGREIGRIRGYPGEDFFWGLLQMMLRKLPAAAPPARTTN
jgi:hypothetical protein